jgi:Nucleolar protein,Nop52
VVRAGEGLTWAAIFSAAKFFDCMANINDINDINDEPRLTPFLKKLASTGCKSFLANLNSSSNPIAIERREREAAVTSLRTFLSRDIEFTQTDFLKLWKGLYYCMWMCDRIHVQQQLADALAELVDVVSCKNTIKFFTTFWATLARQWQTLDQHR